LYFLARPWSVYILEIVEASNRTLATLIVSLLCCGLVSTSFAEANSSETYIAGQYVAASPRAELSSEASARQRAYEVAAANPGTFVVRGQGNSMFPLYTSGTLLVVKPTPFEKLARGMSVVFRKDNCSVAHVLVAKAGKSWRTAGLNNRRHDYLSVDETSVLGIVVAAFTPIEGASVALR